MNSKKEKRNNSEEEKSAHGIQNKKDNYFSIQEELSPGKKAKGKSKLPIRKAHTKKWEGHQQRLDNELLVPSNLEGSRVQTNITTLSQK